MDFIDLKKQYDLIREPLALSINRVLEKGEYILGTEVRELEEKLASYCGVKNCVTVSSGTDALIATLLALEVGPGDEVITSPFSFIASAEAIAIVGATPVFVDIDPDTYNIDANEILEAVTPKTKAIMPVSLYGQCADFSAINEIAGTNDVAVVEDAAQSFGATQHGKRSCGLSLVACTSFYPAKPLGCYGDGGACFTDDDILAEKLRSVRDHGQSGRYQHQRLGLNARLDTIQAAVLLAKLEIFDDELTKRQAAAHVYDELIDKSLSGVVDKPQIKEENTSVFAQYTIRCPRRREVQELLKAEGIPTAVHYPLPIHMQPVFASLDKPVGSFPHAERAATEVLSLPMHPYLERTELELVVQKLTAVIR